jgi:hypothetical protein
LSALTTDFSLAANRAVRLQMPLSSQSGSPQRGRQAGAWKPPFLECDTSRAARRSPDYPMRQSHPAIPTQPARIVISRRLCQGVNPWRCPRSSSRLNSP